MSNDIGPFIFVNGDNDVKGQFFGTLQVGHEEYMHIQKIRVFTGGDDYEESSTVEIKGDGKGGLISAFLDRSGLPTVTRTRFEPGVKIYLDMENGEAAVVTISHHKGQVMVHAQECLKEDLEKY